MLQNITWSQKFDTYVGSCTRRLATSMAMHVPKKTVNA